jgi:hypothetical protein
LVKRALDTQPGLALLLINVARDKAKAKGSGGYQIGNDSCLKVILKLLANKDRNINEYAHPTCSYQLTA